MEDIHARTRAGDSAPVFSLTTIDGKTFGIPSSGGKVCWICFFIITCPHCLRGLRFLQEELVGRVDPGSFELVAIGRQHHAPELAEFRARLGLTMDLAADENRRVYNLFASQKVPRNYLIDRQGTIVQQCRGFRPDEYRHMMGLIPVLTGKTV